MIYLSPFVQIADRSFVSKFAFIMHRVKVGLVIFFTARLFSAYFLK